MKQLIIAIIATALLTGLIGYKIGWNHRQAILDEKIEQSKKEIDEKFKKLEESFNIE